MRSLGLSSNILIALALLALWAVGLRGLGEASFWYDEIFNADLVLNYTLGEMLTVLRTAQPYPPLYYLLLKGWGSLVGARPYAPGLEPAGMLEFLLRFPSLAATVLALATVTALGRRAGLKEAWAISLFLALHPTTLEYARDARMYPLWVFLLLLALLGLVGRRFWLWGVAGAAALLTHYFSLFPLGGALIVEVVLLLGKGRPRPTRNHLLWLGFPFLLAGLWGLIALPVTLGFGSFATGAPPTLSLFLEEMGGLLTGRGVLTPLGYVLPFAWDRALLAAGVAGLVLLGWRRSRSGVLLFSTFLFGAILLFQFWQLRPVHHARYLVWTLPLAAIGLVAVVEVPLRALQDLLRESHTTSTPADRFTPHPNGSGEWGATCRSDFAAVRRVRTSALGARWAMMALVLLALAWETPTTGRFLAAPRTLWYPDFRGAVVHLNHRAGPEDRGIAVAAHALQVLRVYRTSVPFTAGPEIGQRLRPDEGARLLEAHRPAGEGRYWVLLYQDDAVDPGGVVLGTLEQAGGYRVEMVYTREARLFAYALPDPRPFQPLAPERSVDAVFRGGIHLQGASIHREERLVPVYLFWELTAPQARSLVGAVHLVAQLGERPVTQWDRPVLNEYWPLPRLPVGEVLPNRYELLLPPDLPPGTYLLYALLYDPVTGERLRTERGEELVPLGELLWP
ncbi:MAG: hypothetical protein N3B68_13175 [Anaerolineae bacterium]|nr:hypothetical protein [Anaerolineae bacterium]